jgi:hemerythrin
MPIAKWSDAYLTGHPMIDKQHQGLFRLVNELHDAMIAGNASQVVGATLETLTHYTIEHFRAEEALMVQIKYPRYDEHKKKHEELTAKAKQIIEQQFKTGKVVISITLSGFLYDWLRHHIKEEDMALIQYMRSSSAQAETRG